MVDRVEVVVRGMSLVIERDGEGSAWGQIGLRVWFGASLW